MKTKSSYGNSKALGLCFLGAMASTSHAQLQSAGSLLVDLNFTTLTPGDLPFVANAGTLGGGFESFGSAAAIPVIQAAPKTTVKGLYLDGGDFMMSVTAQTPIGGIPSRLDAPAGLIGAQASRSVEAWVYNESLADEETAVAWGKRGGPDGSNYSCLYGVNATWGALGQWGGPDLGWAGAIPPVAGSWHHLTWVHTGTDEAGMGADPNNTLVYVDGVLNTSENAGILTTHPGPLLLGAQMTANGVTVEPANRGSMYLGKVRVHDGALTADQVLNNYNFEAAGFPPTNMATALAPKTGPIHRWSFAEATGTKVTDSTGFLHGVVKGANSTWTGSSITLPGGSGATEAYVDLPNRLLSSHAPELGGPGEVTLEMWVTVTGNRNWSRIFDFGSTNGNEISGPGGGGDGWDYLFLSAQEGGNTGRNVLSLRHRDPLGNGPLGAGGPGDVNPNIAYDTATFGNQRHLTVVWKDRQVISIYEDGLPTRELRPGDIKMVQLNDVNCWLGRSTWLADQNLQGDIDEFRIYDRALSPGEVLQTQLDGPDAVLPVPPDDDNDTLPNWYERLYASATLDMTVGGQASLDGDTDGRTNFQEFQEATNPNLADTDGDGLNDGGEFARGTNPLLKDTDGDGLTDGAEVNTHSSNPLLLDTDSDGYADGQEVAGGSSPSDANSIPVIFLVARYSFANAAGAADGSQVTESVSGLHGYVRGTGGTWTGNALTLPGGSSDSAPYVDLPNHLMSRFAKAKGGRGSVTMEGWVTVPTRTGAAWQRILDFGSSHPGSNLGEIFNPGRTIPGDTAGQDYFFLSAARGDDVNLRRVDWTNNDAVGGAGNALGVDSNASAGTVDALFHYAITFDETLGQLRYYENGVEVSSGSTTLRLDALNDVNCWLGRSNWTGDGNFGGDLDEFRFYAGLFSPSDVLKSFNKGPNTIPNGTNPATDVTTLKITNVNGWPEWYVDRVPGLPAATSDTDGDGLTALAELGRGSSPTAADTDGDGLGDAMETNSGTYVNATSTGTSPVNPDTDDDGLTDSQEVAALTNPFVQDSDGDLVFDGSDALPLSTAATVMAPAHRWTFDDLGSSGVAGDTPSADLIGGAAFNAIIRGTNASSDGASVILPGGANNNDNAYIDLPNGLISSQSRVTLAGWVTVNAISNWSRILDFGSSGGAEVPPAGIGNGTDYLFYSAFNGIDQNLQRFAMQDAPGGESFYNITQPTPLGVETFFAITIDSIAGDRSVYTLYREGQWGMRMFGARYPLASINDVNCWLGRSQFAGDPQLNGNFNEFRVYNGVLNESAIRSLYATGTDGMLTLISALKNGNQLDLTWESRDLLTYTIESSPDLVTWLAVNSNLPSAGVTTTASVPIGTGRLYYRVRVD
jgi:hypothetical protein